MLQQIVAELEIECLVTDIPDAIRHNVTEMGKDSVLHVKELTLPNGVRVLQDEDLIVAMVREIEEQTEAADAEAAAEPEVIGKGKEDEAAEGAAEEAK